MSQHITYFTSHVSPYNYLGAARFRQMVQARGLMVDMKIMDLGLVFPETGGLPLPKRAPERRAYRLQELTRFSEFHHLPLTLQPAHFPPSSMLGALVIAAARRNDTMLAMQVLEIVLTMTWADEQDSGDKTQLAAALTASGCDADGLISLAQKESENLQAEIVADSHLAIKEGVFGGPSFKVGDELFWGQDRLDMLAWYLDKKG